MRVSREEKERSRERIVASASKLLRAAGAEGASVANVMQDAGLTHGGFYRHFATKDDMVDAALGHAFDQFIAPLRDGVAAGTGAEALAAFRRLYLSDGHVAHPGSGCPAAAVGPDIARGAPSAKKAFGDGVSRITTILSSAFPGPPERRRKRAMREFAMMLGAVVIARASDRDTATAVLDACREDK